MTEKSMYSDMLARLLKHKTVYDVFFFSATGMCAQKRTYVVTLRR